VQISLLAERGVVEYEENFVDASGKKWTEANIAEEIEDIGFEAEVVERSEVQQVELRIYGWVSRCQNRADASGWRIPLWSTPSLTPRHPSPVFTTHRCHSPTPTSC
jgi:hypothetical protein